MPAPATWRHGSAPPCTHGVRLLAPLLALTFLVLGARDARALTPAYLADMPSPPHVLASIHGSDPLDTAARQAAAFNQLGWTLRALTAQGEVGSSKLTPDEEVLAREYEIARNAAMNRGRAVAAVGATPTGFDAAGPRWARAYMHYDLTSYRLEVLGQLAPSVRALYDAKGKGAPPALGPPPSNAPALSQGPWAAAASSTQGRNAIMGIGVVLVVLVALLLIGTRNSLYKRRLVIKQHNANITHIVEMKSTMVNELAQVVRSQVQADQLVHLTVSRDSAGGGIAGAYQQAGAVLNAVQNFAQRFPQLQQNGNFRMMMDNIQHCEVQLLQGRQFVNKLVGDYNGYRGNFPRNLFAGLLGFREEEFVNFDVANARGPAQAIQLGTEDGRRLDQVLGSAPPVLSAPQPLAAPIGRASLPSGRPGLASAPQLMARGGGTEAFEAVPSLPNISIRFLAGPLDGRSVPVGAGTVVGREAGAAQVVVPDPQVSSAHAWIGLRSGALTFVDQGSTNGSLVNGAQVRAGDEVPLKHGDVVALGRTNSVRFVVVQS